MHDFFFFYFGVGEKTAISWREGQLKWLVWPLGKCPLLISRLSPVGGSQNKRWVGTIFSHSKANTRACAHWEEQTEPPLRFISQSSPAFSTYNLIWAWQTLLVTYPTSTLGIHNSVICLLASLMSKSAFSVVWQCLCCAISYFCLFLSHVTRYFLIP